MSNLTKLLPQALRNGESLPRRFSEVLAVTKSNPKYKIVIYSIDSFSSWHRIVHVYYISVLSSDPSNVQKFMRTLSLESIVGFEDGKKIDELMVFNGHLKMEKMDNFRAKLEVVIQDNSSSYAMVSFHNVVQFSNNRFDENLVFTSMMLD